MKNPFLKKSRKIWSPVSSRNPDFSGFFMHHVTRVIYGLQKTKFYENLSWNCRPMVKKCTKIRFFSGIRNFPDFFHPKPRHFLVDSGNQNFLEICWELAEEIANTHTYSTHTHTTSGIYILIDPLSFVKMRQDKKRDDVNIFYKVVQYSNAKKVFCCHKQWVV